MLDAVADLADDVERGVLEQVVDLADAAGGGVLDGQHGEIRLAALGAAHGIAEAAAVDHDMGFAAALEEAPGRLLAVGALRAETGDAHRLRLAGAEPGEGRLLEEHRVLDDGLEQPLDVFGVKPEAVRLVQQAHQPRHLHRRCAHGKPRLGLGAGDLLDEFPALGEQSQKPAVARRDLAAQRLEPRGPAFGRLPGRRIIRPCLVHHRVPSSCPSAAFRIPLMTKNPAGSAAGPAALSCLLGS